MAKARLLLFGGLQLTGGVQTARPIRPKSLALLAYLLIERRPVSRSHLCAMFWPAQTEAAARRHLSWTLNNLRAPLPDCLEVHGENVQASAVPGFSVDVWEFDELIGRLDAAALQRAADLYRGPLFDGFYLREAADFELWQLREQEKRRSLLADGLDRLVTLYLAGGEPQRALAAAERWLGEDPWREAAHRAVMRALAQLGRREAAVRQFERLRRLLADELQTRPGAATVALVDQLRAPAERPAPQADAGNVPLPPTRLLGRSDERRRLTALLRDPDYRLITLLGPGGVGKTHLALAVGRELAAAFADGVWFVTLADVAADSAEEGLALAILDALGVREQAKGSLIDQLITNLRTKELLLILDNFEQLAKATLLVNTLLSRVAGVKLLITSRMRLQLRAEYVLRLDGLPFPSAAAVEEPARAVTESETLFLERTERLGQELRLSPENRRAIADICRLVEGMPLGIELASGATAELSPPEIAAHLQSNLDGFVTQWRDVPPRQRSLEAAFVYAWEALTAELRWILAGAAHFAGGMSRAAGKAVLGATAEQLEALVDRSLLQPDGERYQMHQLSARFALSRTADPSIAMRFNAHFVAHLGETIAAYRQQRDEALLADLTPDLPNILTVWRSLVAAQAAEELIPFAGNLFAFFGIRGRLHEGHAVFGAALGQLTMAWPTAERTLMQRKLLAMLAARTGYFLLFFGDHAAARPLLEAALATFLEQEDEAEVELPMTALHDIANRQGDFQESLRLSALALERLDTAKPTSQLARALTNLGLQLAAIGRFEAAREHHERAVAIERQLGYDHALATALNNLGSVLIDLGDLAGAQQAVEEAHALRRRIGNSHRIASGQLNLGALALARTSASEALDHFRQAQHSFEQAGLTDGRLAAQVGCARAYLQIGDAPAARRELGRALELVTTQDETPRVLQLLAVIGAYWLTAGQKVRAAELLTWVAGHRRALAQTRTLARNLLHDCGVALPGGDHEESWSEWLTVCSAELRSLPGSAQ